MHNKFSMNSPLSVLASLEITLHPLLFLLLTACLSPFVGPPTPSLPLYLCGFCYSSVALFFLLLSQVAMT